MIMNLEWKCPKCKKIIYSVSKGQQDYNAKLHLEKHKRKDESRK